MKQGNKVGNDEREESLLYVREGISTRVAFIEQMIFGQRPGGSEGASNRECRCLKAGAYLAGKGPICLKLSS